ncbi:MAG: HD domain-containing protein [Nitrospirae bacterium]|nr:HD domain-containing protein [Nitrospirota bacterium]
MTNDDLNSLKLWFSDYTSSFFGADEGDNRNLRLKVEHTQNVCANIKEIAESLPLTSEKIILAETIALFHDIGRFSQYTKYKTFQDGKSINHGLLGAKILQEENLLSGLAAAERNLIFNSVKFHNVFQIPDLKDEELLLFQKLIRDADKLDILRVFINFYESPPEQRASATAFRLPDTPEYSKEILERIYKKQKVSYESLKTVNDFRLMNISWGYAMNFKASYRLLKEWDCLNRIARHLPATEDIAGAVALVRKFVEEQLP